MYIQERWGEGKGGPWADERAASESVTETEKETEAETEAETEIQTQTQTQTDILQAYVNTSADFPTH